MSNKPKDISQNLNEIRVELDRKIESKLPIWVFFPIILLLFTIIGGAYWHCMEQILDLVGRVSAVERYKSR